MTENSEIVVDNAEEVKDKVDSVVHTALYALGLFLVGEAKTYLGNDPIRIDTGLLKNSIAFALGGEPANVEKGGQNYQADRGRITSRAKDGSATRSGELVSGSYSGKAPGDRRGQLTLYVGTNVDYGKIVHEGTEKMAANPFLKNAVENNKQKVYDYFQEATRGEGLN